MNSPRALVLTHGRLGAELVRVTEMILGPADGLDAMSNQGSSNLDLVADIKTWLDASESAVETETAHRSSNVIFVDDYAGSCGTVARLACEQAPETIVITGVNLAMLLGFLTWRTEIDGDDLALRLVNKGREAIGRASAGR